MPQPKRPAAPKLPPVTVARFREGMLLMERLVDEQASVFVQRGQDYREVYRDGNSRPLNAMEVGQIAAGLGVELQEARAQIEAAELTHHDEPDAAEVLLAAGVATAPAFLDAGLRLYALLAMPAKQFETAREAGTLDDELDAAVAALDDVDMKQMRDRAGEAFAHLAEASGVEPGKAWATIGQAMWQALNMAAAQLGATMHSASSTGSAEPTADSPGITFSTN